MMPQVNLLSDLHTYAHSLIKKYRIPAVSLAVWHNGEIRQGAAGILNINTGVKATTDSIFRIGSITKVFTACLVMKLLDEDRVDLDTPVKHYLRDFQIADPQATETITVRHLLNHTNGMAGDYFPDDSHAQGNWIARYVDRCNLLPLVHPVGEIYSYSNSAFAIAGRLVEVVSGISWFDAIQEAIFKPLGMEHAIANPIDIVRFRAAVGHRLSSGKTGRWELHKTQYPTLGLAPAGGTINMTATDLITFARAFLDKGLTQTGERWLSESSVGQMQTPQLEKPTLSKVIKPFMGLGWEVSDHLTKGTRVISHSGLSRGQCAMLQILPDQNIAVAIMLNGHKAGVLQAITHEILQATAGLSCAEPELIPVTLDETRLSALIGRYQSYGEAYAVRSEGDCLWASCTEVGLDSGVEHLRLMPIGDDCFAVYSGDDQLKTMIRFMNFNSQGQPDYLYTKQRICTRVV